MRSARGPAPRRSIASRFSAHASDPGPYRPPASDPADGGSPRGFIRGADMSEGSGMTRWGADFDPDRLADLETAMWKAYYRKQPARLYGYLLKGIREQAHVSWPRAIVTSLFWTKAAAQFGNTFGEENPDYDRFAPDIARGYRLLGLPASVDAEEVGRRELRWWVVRREIGLAAGEAAGDAITRLYSSIYQL